MSDRTSQARGSVQKPMAIAAGFLLAAALAAAGDFEAPLTLDLTGIAYFHPGEPPRRLEARLLAEPLWAISPWGEVTGAIALNADSDHEFDRRADPDWEEQALRRRTLEVRELALTAHLTAADLTLGKQIRAWGVGDGLRPTDSLTPRDLTDPLRDERLGAWGVSADLFFGNLESTIAVLRHAPHRLPLLDRRWSPVGDLGGVSVEREFQAGNDNWIAAFQLSGYASAFDWSLVARRGPDLAPHLAAASTAGLTLDYPQMSLVGGWISAPVGDWVIRGEVAWRGYDRRPGRPEAEDFATALAGFERRFPGLVFGEDATLITEVVHEVHTAGPELPRDVAVLDPVRLIRTGVYATLLVHNPTGLEAEAGGAVDLAEGGGLVRLLARYNAGDRVDVEVGVDLLFSGGNKALLPIENNDRLVVRLVIRI